MGLVSKELEIISKDNRNSRGNSNNSGNNNNETLSSSKAHSNRVGSLGHQTIEMEQLKAPLLGPYRAVRATFTLIRVSGHFQVIWWVGMLCMRTSPWEGVIALVETVMEIPMATLMGDGRAIQTPVVGGRGVRGAHGREDELIGIVFVQCILLRLEENVLCVASQPLFSR